MEFRRIDKTSYPLHTHLTSWVDKFELVEIRQLDPSGEWCIRVTVNTGKGGPFKLAAIAKTLERAEQKMESMLTTYR